MIASGTKTLEIRCWAPGIGPAEDLLIVENTHYLREDGEEEADGLPVALVNVRHVRPFALADMAAACATYFEEGWLAWELANIRPIQTSVKVRAARKIYVVASW